MAGEGNRRDPPGDGPVAATGEAVAAVFHETAGRLTGYLTRVLGDFGAAEDIVQEALLVALDRWPLEGIPERPGAWLLTVARHRAIDLARRNARLREKLSAITQPADQEPDDRLRLLFTCCHPALAQPAQVALTLRTVCGLTTPEIARAFLTSEATMAQRLVRAKRKIAAAAIPYRIPPAGELQARLAGVLAVIYLLFSEGYPGSGGSYERDRAGESPAGGLQQRDLAAEAEWLSALLATLMPAEPEVLGLLALIRLHQARASARVGPDGSLVLLREQDRSRWDGHAIGAATALLVRAAGSGLPGPYQLQAAIVACHAEAESWESTDWWQILLLYDLLISLDPSPVFRLNRAVAVRYAVGAEAALVETDRLGAALDGYYLLHSIRAEFLRDLGRLAESRVADARALALAANPAERALLAGRLA